MTFHLCRYIVHNPSFQIAYGTNLICRSYSGSRQWLNEPISCISNVERLKRVASRNYFHHPLHTPYVTPRHTSQLYKWDFPANTQWTCIYIEKYSHTSLYVHMRNTNPTLPPTPNPLTAHLDLWLWWILYISCTIPKLLTLYTWSRYILTFFFWAWGFLKFKPLVIFVYPHPTLPLLKCLPTPNPWRV